MTTIAYILAKATCN